jgi:NAD(P)-dependent dehydrogenase (short-subunit alcohol dehydrogenase family)
MTNFRGPGSRRFVQVHELYSQMHYSLSFPMCGRQEGAAVTSEARSVFVAGGTSGINLAVAEAFADQGCKVAVLSRSPEKVDSTVARLSERSPALGYVGDVRDPVAVADAFREAAAAHGPIDVVVSGAAGNFVAPAAEMSANGFKAVVDIDLLGTFNVLRAAWEHVRKPGASIVNISAAQSWLPTAGQAHVCAAKAGVDQLTRTLALEWGPAGVRVNSVAPGPVEGTEGMRRLAPTPAAVAGWTQAVPLRRFATTTDIAGAVLWLTSDAASYVTGVVLSVDGGLCLGGSGAAAAAMQAV